MRKLRSSTENSQIVNETNDSSERNTSEIAAETIDFIDEAMTHIQSFEAIQRDVDRSLFNPQYLKEIPFTRIGLQPVFITVAGERLDIDVGVLIHRTGVAILTFYAMFSGKKSADELITLQQAGQVKIESSEVARAIVEPGASASGIKSSDLNKIPSERRHSSGVEWFVYRDQKNVTLVNVFELYQDAIISAVWKKEPAKTDEPGTWLRTPDWLAYPIVFIRHIIPAVSKQESFPSRNPKMLTGLIWRFPHWREMKEEIALDAVKDDYSIITDHSLYIEPGHATVLYYRSPQIDLFERYSEDVSGQIWLIKHFQTSAVIDVFLIQYGTLSILNKQLLHLPYNPDKLNTLKRDVLLALEEHHSFVLAYRGAHNIVRRAGEKMGIPGIYEGVMQKLNNLERMMEVLETRRRNRRDRTLQILALVFSWSILISGTWPVVKAIGDWSTLPSDAWWVLESTFFKSVVQFVHTHPIFSALSIYLVLFLAFTLLIIWALWPARKQQKIVETDQSKPALKPGFTWPTSAIIEQTEEAARPQPSHVET